MTPARRSVAAIAAATALNLPFGTIYAFRVFLKPMESQLGISRAQMSLVFALAAITLTVAMLLTPRLYRRFSPVMLILACGAVAAVGVLLAAYAGNYAELLIGYGVLFGLGGGVGFILVQQGVNQSVVKHSGLANGYVVSLYPLGAMIGAPLFGWSIAAFGLRETLIGLAATVAVSSALAARLIHHADIRMLDPAKGPMADRETQWALFMRLFVVFLLAASAGLMVMSQAVGIIAAYGGQAVLALGATTFITGAIAAARIAGGWLVDRLSLPQVASGAHLLSLLGAVALTLWPGPWVAVPALAMIGTGYGLISGATAGGIAQYWQKNEFGRVASRTYIAWCLAAISLPVVAGWLFDRTQGYQTAVLIAAAGNALGIWLALGLPRRGAAQNKNAP